MAGLQLKVTPAGRAAIVNLPNTGTNAVTITEIGVTATAFDPNTMPGTLPGELKRVTTFGGSAVADDTIHITLNDDSTDSYSLRGFALYLADGTLFALYGQAGVILEKSAQATLLLSVDVKFADIDATVIEFGDANFTNPPATTSVFGVTRYATDGEAATGAADNRSITARALKYVLDSRFGAGAPSAFMKGLLSLATATLVRAALEIKGAALHDAGAGNGLDADLLDGQHGAYYRAWANMTGVPATFAPSAHSHAAGDITTGVFANARVSQASVTQHQAALSIAWGQITGLPAQATRWPTWSEVTNKPSTYAPSAHQHDAGDITSGRLSLDRMPTSMGMHTSNVSGTPDLDAKMGDASGVIGWVGSATGSPAAYTYAGMHLAWSATAAAQFGFVLSTGSDDFSWRCANAGGWGAWRTAWHDGNQLAIGKTAATARTALGLGSAAEANVGTSGANVPRLNAANTWSGKQTFNVGGAVPENQSMEFGGGAIRGASTALVVGGAGGRILLRPNGDAATAGEASLSSAGLFTAPALDASSGSDERLKTDLHANPYGLAEVLQIATKVGRYLPTYTQDDRKRLFVIAQQLAPLIPELVVQDGIEIDGERYSTVDYLGLVPVLINAVQQLHGRLAELEAR